MLDKIRVLLANHPAIIPDTIRDLVEQQADMELVGDCRGPMKILQETGRYKADAVIISQEGTDEPGLCSQLLAVYPDLTIVSVISNKAWGYTQLLCARRRKFVISKEMDIVQALRAATRALCREEDAP